MTINSPVLAGNWLFWSPLEDKYVTPTFILQRYGGPIWWTERFRILMLIEGANNNGYQIASSSIQEDIIGNWDIILAVYQDKVDKTGLKQFSETYLLNLIKKLAKKMAKLEELNTKRLKLSSDSVLNINNNNSSCCKNDNQPQAPQSPQPKTTTGPSSTSSYSPTSSSSSLSFSSYNIVIPSNMAIVSTMNDNNEKSSIRLGNQRRIATLFKALYHIDPITILERTYVKKYEEDEWVEWMDERTGMRPIHIAVEKMDIALIKYLLEKSADVNIKDAQGWSPLHFASYAGNLDICHLLIEQGKAAVLSISKDGTLPLHYLARHSFEKAQSNKFLQVLQLLLDKGTPIDAKTIRGETALHRAAFFGSIQVLNFLIDQNADLNIQNVRGETPLYFAVIGRHKQIVTLLVERGADCNLGGPTGNALDAARKTGQQDLFFFLSGFSKSLDSFDYNEYDDEVEIESNSLISGYLNSGIGGGNSNNNSHSDLPRHQIHQINYENDEDDNQNNNNNSNSNQDSIRDLQQKRFELKMKEKTEKLKVNHKNFYPHIFVLIDFRGPTWCSLCGYFLWGLRRQGFACEVCGYCVHPKCKKNATLTDSCIIAKQLDQKDLANSDTVDQFLSTSRHHIDKPLHKQSINRKRLESLYNQFNTLDKEQHGCIYKKEFGECLGSLIKDSDLLSEMLFQAFDSNNDGKMDLKDFLHGVSVLQNSSQEEQIHFAFQMIDRNNRGYITVGELRQVLQSIYQALGNLKINTIQPEALLRYILPPHIVYKEIKAIIFSKGYKNSKLVKSLSVDSKIGHHREEVTGSKLGKTSLPADTTSDVVVDSTTATSDINGTPDDSDVSILTKETSFIQIKDIHSNQSTPSSSIGSISESPITDGMSSNVTSTMSLPKAMLSLNENSNEITSKSTSTTSITPPIPTSSSIEINKVEVHHPAASPPSSDSSQIGDADTAPSASTSVDSVITGRLRSSGIRSIMTSNKPPLMTSQSLPTNTEDYLIKNNSNNNNNDSNNNNNNNYQIPFNLTASRVLPINNNNNNNNNNMNFTYPSTTNQKKATIKKYSTEINLEGRIYFEDYQAAMLKHSNFIQSLGLVELDDNTKEQHNQVSKWMSFEGKEITLGHESWEIMQYIMIGIRRAVGETMTLTNRPLKQKDYDVIVEFKYNNWVFKDFAPFPFKKIRDKLDIDPKHFMFSLGPEKIFGNLLLGNLSVLCEVVTSGRSGSMFFRSNEGRYLMKTIPPNEEFVLKSILPNYVQHILKYPNSLLTKTLGCYNMTMKNKDLRFIVMNNLFFTPLPIHEKYDLKGSTIGRHVELQEGENEGEIADISLKDLDFKRTLNIGPEFKAPLMEQIEHDTKLLESHNICDYSLLVGVHRVDEYSPIALASENDVLSKDIFDVLDEGFFKKTSGTSLFQQHYGGILSSDKKEVYFIAIIDTLTTWNYKKKYENMFKSLVHDSSQISAIDPTSYRARFQRLIQQIVK